MQSELWGSLAHMTPNRDRISHRRESSSSSFGSTGPASPYVENTSKPYIAFADSNLEGLIDAYSQDYSNAQTESLHQLGKSMCSASQLSYFGMDGSIPNLGCSNTVSGLERKPRVEHGHLPALELGGSCTKPHSASAVSSPGDDSSETAAIGGLEQSHRRKHGYNTIPKLDRTMTDVYGDELYNPNFVITSTTSPQPCSVISAGSHVFSERINAANNQHLSAAQPPSSTLSRARSPFRTSSPFSTFAAREIAPRRCPSTKRWSEQDQYSQTQKSRSEEPETPKTISPKDAILEFKEADGDWVLPLFPQNSSHPDIASPAKSMNTRQPDSSYMLASAADPQSHGLGHLASQAPAEVHVPQQNSAITRPLTSHDTPPRLSSSGASSVTSGDNTPTSGNRPSFAGADGGTYTCTYHGCFLRFDTPTTLQKHKREGHRHTQGLVAPRVQDARFSSNMPSSQAGPHRCDGINPSTGKPCNTIFSRPYDLTRHQDTIHNAHKQKVRCNLCSEEKTFSRADALTRHYRVCHPNMEVPGKYRRRGGVLPTGQARPSPTPRSNAKAMA